MWDFTPNPDLARLLHDADRRDAIIAAVCHGAAGLLSTPAHGPPVKGRTLTGFSDEEETALGLADVVPFLLQARLTAEGAAVSTGPAFQPDVVADGHLVTGQNPSSARGVAEKVLSLLRSRRKELRWSASPGSAPGGRAPAEVAARQPASRREAAATSPGRWSAERPWCQPAGRETLYYLCREDGSGATPRG
jgi:hypothetical protein